MTTYVYINGTSGSTNPTTKFYTDPQVPAPTTEAWNSLANAEADASIRARTDDLVFVCVGSVGPVIMSTSLSCSSITIEGNVSTAAWNEIESTSSQTTNTTAAIEILKPVSATIKNMQVSNTGGASNPYGIKFSQATGSGTNTVDGCKIRLVGTSLSGEGYAARQTTSGYTFIVKNSIAFQSGAPQTSRQGFYALYTATCHAYNSIAYGFTSGGASAGFTGFDTVVNCVSFGNTTDFLACDSVSYCASDDGTGSNAVSGLNWNNEFQWFIDGDFRVKPGSSLLNAGIGPGSNANIPTVDITGAARSGSTTSIGASNTDTSSITVTRYVNTASSGGDGTTNATSGANAAYSSLLAWNTAEATNLTTSQKLHIVYCEGGQDTLAQNTGIGMGGWTTNELYYPTITTTNANRSTLGRLDTSKYHLYKIGSGTWADIIQYVKHTKVIGIQFYIRGNSGSNAVRQCLVANTTNDIALVAENCIFDCGGNSTGGVFGRPWNWTSSNSTYPNYFRNNLVIFDSSNDASAVINTTQGSGVNNTFFYNNTFIDKKNTAIVFAINSSNASVWKNNIFQGFLTHFTSGTGNIDGSDYNLTNLPSLSYGTNNTLNTKLNYAPNTYLLSTSDSAVLSEGIGTSADRYVPLTDSLGNLRVGNTTSVGPFNTLSNSNYLILDQGNYTTSYFPATLIADADLFTVVIDPPPGYAVHNVTDLSQAGSTSSIYYGLSVSIGDQFLYKTTTETNNWSVSVAFDGVLTATPTGVDTVKFWHWNQTTWSSQLTYSLISNISPLSAEVTPFSINTFETSLKVSRKLIAESYTPVQLWSDDFTGAEGILGSEYTQQGDTNVRRDGLGNAYTTGGGRAIAWPNTVTFSNNQYAEITLTQISYATSASSGLALRVQTNESPGVEKSYIFRTGNQGEAYLFAEYSETSSFVLKITTTIIPKVGDRLKAVAIGNTLYFYVNDQLITEASDISWPGGVPGIYGFNQQWKSDEFVAGNHGGVTFAGTHTNVLASRVLTCDTANYSVQTFEVGNLLSRRLFALGEYRLQTFSDNFERANESLDVNPNWLRADNEVDSLSIIGGKASGVNVGNVYNQTLSNDQWVEIYFEGPFPTGVDKGAAVLLRATGGLSTFSGYSISLMRDNSAPGDILSIRRHLLDTTFSDVFNAGLLLASIRIPELPSPPTLIKLRAEIIGNTIYAYVNDFLWLTVSDSQHSSGKVGIWSDSSPISSFSCGSIGGTQLIYQEVSVIKISATKIEAITQTYSIIPSEASLLRGLAIPVTAQAFTLTGPPVALKTSRKLAVQSTSLNVVSQQVSLERSFRVFATSQSYTLAGPATTLTFVRKIQATSKTFTLSTSIVVFDRGYVLVTTPSEIAITFPVTGVYANRRIYLTTQTYFVPIRVWDGGAWTPKPLKIWTGTEWQIIL